MGYRSFPLKRAEAGIQIESIPNLSTSLGHRFAGTSGSEQPGSS